MKFIYDIYRKLYTIQARNGVISRKSCSAINSNLKRFQNKISLYSRCFASVVGDNLSKTAVKKFLDHATKVYEGKEEDKSEIGEILKNQEVKQFVQERVNILENIQSLDELTKEDKKMEQLAEEEFVTYTNSLETVDERLLELLSIGLGRDICESIVLEITAGVGGEESRLFAYELLEMYCQHFNYLNYKFDFMEREVTEVGGIRHASLTISGRGVYEKFRHEAGIHRVQRVPSTESSGRVHTSVVSVVIYPQPSEIEVKILDKDLKIDTFRSKGAGGQSVNKTDSAVRITHLPSGTVVECQSERSQIRNKSIAMIKLRTKIYNARLNEQMTKNRNIRQKQMGFKNRNERIRTYNYMQDRVTDHRIDKGTIFGLSDFMEGGDGLKELQDKLQRDYEKKTLIDTINEINKKN